MTFLAAAWEQIYGLLVEDGQIAIGTLLAFIVTAAFAYFAGQDLRNVAGWLLFVLLMGLLLANLYATGRKAAARRTGG
jgi:FtsH-binding integral membrane protein